MNTKRSGVPAGVNEQEYRRALERMRQSSATDNVSALAASSAAGMSAMHSSALQSDLAKKYNLPGASRNSHSVVRAAAKASTSVGRASSKLQSSTPEPHEAKSSSTTSSTRSNTEVHTNANSSSGNRLSTSTAGIITTAHKTTQVVPAGPPVTCGSCDFDNEPGSTVCDCCGYFLMSARQQNMTLAQKMGIAEGPKKVTIVSLDEWDAIERRAGERDEAFCPICMVGFNQGNEVLLSCSHMFHRACILSFEKYTQQKERLCPMCRFPEYQKRLTRKGSQAFQIVCATKLKALFRGYICRKKFRSILKSFYREGKGSGTMQRRKFYEQELSSYANEIDKDIDKRSQEVDTMMRYCCC